MERTFLHTRVMLAITCSLEVLESTKDSLRNTEESAAE